MKYNVLIAVPTIAFRGMTATSVVPAAMSSERIITRKTNQQSNRISNSEMRLLPSRNFMKPKLKMLIAMIAVAVAFCGGIGVGAYCFMPHNVEQVLDLSRKKLEKELMENGDFSQTHLNTLSGYLREITYMQCYWIGLEICNSDYYSKIEPEYLKEYESWHQAFHAEDEKPSEYEGGTMAPLDCNMRLYGLLCERLNTLNTKYRKR
ncbi:MAG: hypothetical protein PHT84_05270 [Candidatus Pacebacteria bacterium]|nr:hypothetical protein [Candidatus Paceibacterota bacterium]